jgi:hypothetical protein
VMDLICVDRVTFGSQADVVLPFVFSVSLCLCGRFLGC